MALKIANQTILKSKRFGKRLQITVVLFSSRLEQITIRTRTPNRFYLCNTLREAILILPYFNSSYPTLMAIHVMSHEYEGSKKDLELLVGG